MPEINRDIDTLARRRFDVAVVGGGVQGAFIALEAVRRGLSCVVLEKDDFGANTSYNSLRIVHGGLRYLQKADMPRFAESVAERNWFLRVMPDLVRPLPCLMPLYGRGLRRPSVFRVALALNDLASSKRNDRVRASRRIPSGRILDAAEVQSIWHGVPERGLRGGAVWYDASVPDSQRLIVELLLWASEYGAVPLNYVEALPMANAGDETPGLLARDCVTGATRAVDSETVIWATGPWQYPLGGGEIVHGDRQFSLAWNVLFDLEAPADHALAVAPPGNNAQTYFIHPWKGRLLAGTGHAPWQGELDDIRASEEQIQQMIEALNLAAPSLGIRLEDVLRIYSGLLPVTHRSGTTLSDRPTMVEHRVSSEGSRIFSVSGVKMTTARSVADRLLSKAFPAARPDKAFYESPRKTKTEALVCATFAKRPPLSSDTISAIRAIAAEEAVIHLDDIVFRRTDIGDDPRRAIAMGGELFDALEWDPSRKAEELMRLGHTHKTGLRSSFPGPSGIGAAD